MHITRVCSIAQVQQIIDLRELAR